VAERILIVDDDPSLHEVARTYLRLEGYTVDSALDGGEALALAASRGPAVVVLDFMLPDISGEEVLEQLRRRSRVPVLMISGSARTEDRVRALTAGADDYLTKPFSARELVARVKALLRRAGADNEGPAILSFGHGLLEIDTNRREVRVGGEVRALTRTQYDILATLAGRPGRVYSRAELAAGLRGHDFEVSERVIDSHVAGLRRRIEDPSGPRIVETVRGAGYRIGLTPS
jgi:DNA-binding response OmpR family regulator